MELTIQKIQSFKNEIIKKLEEELEYFLQEFNPPQVVYFKNNIETDIKITKKDKLSLFLAYFSNEPYFYIYPFKDHQFIFDFNILNKILYYEILLEVAIEFEFYEICDILLFEKNSLIYLTASQENITKNV